MVLETLYETLRSEKHPLTLTLVAFIITTAAMLIAYNNFPESTSALTMLFITIGFMPIVHKIFVGEEEKVVDEKDRPFAFISTHFNVIHSYGWMFVGMVIAFGFWAVALPDSNDGCSGLACIVPTKNDVFTEQKKVYSAITGKAIFDESTGNAVGQAECFGESKSFDRCFMLIFKNNFGVMSRAIAFSFVWGAGAIELLAWNASVIGFFIGSEVFSKSLDAGIARAIGYLPHGAPEITAYFIAAIAGGIINAMVSKSKFRKHEISLVVTDVVMLLVLATIILFLGALIETATIFGMLQIAIGGIIAFFTLFLILYIPSVRYGISQMREP
ncbi:Stage II sporulation protein M [uncultured archaeon]|nr:Stage II sporulation protein M [uncultured archaeon]